MMEVWEGALAVRDGVYAQIFFLVLGGFVVYRLLARPMIKTVVTVGLIIFVGLYIASVLNIVIWQP
jgi:hypothetical protein